MRSKRDYIPNNKLPLKEDNLMLKLPIISKSTGEQKSFTKEIVKKRENLELPIINIERGYKKEELKK